MQLWSVESGLGWVRSDQSRVGLPPEVMGSRRRTPFSAAPRVRRPRLAEGSPSSLLPSSGLGGAAADKSQLLYQLS